MRRMPWWGWALVLLGGAVTFAGSAMATIFVLSLRDEALADKTAGGGAGKPTYSPKAADELLNDWRPNPAAESLKYKVNGVEVAGVLNHIDSWAGSDSLIRITGTGGAQAGYVRVIVSSAVAKDGLRKCKVGQRIVVKARSEGKTDDTPWLVADEIRPGD